MATEQEFVRRIQAGLASGKISREDALAAIKKYRELSPQASQTTEVIQTPDLKIATQQTVEEPSFLDRVAQASSDIASQINRSLQGVGESALSVGSAALAEPVSGLAGLAAMIPGGRTPAEAVEATREFMTYDPKTQAGQQAMEELGGVLAPVGEAIEFVEQGAGEIGYRGAGLIPGVSEEVQAGVGAIASAIPATVAEIIGFKGTRAAKKAALAEQVQQSGIDQVMTPEVVVALRKQGFTDKDINDVVRADPAQIERLERFQRQGIQPTRGDITMETAQRKAEQQLMETAQGEAAEQMRQLRVQQSQALQTNFDEMIDAYGIPEDTGQTIKDAVKSRQKIAKEDARKAYDALAQAQGGAENIPILMPSFNDLPDLPTARELRSIKRADKTNYNALQDALAEFGLSTDEGALARLADEGVEIDALDVGNFEELRQALNVIRRNDEAGNMSRILEPIIGELDRQIDIATNALMTSG
ncbi:MAG: hypothetical protein HRU12_15355, partial [Phaeodactylibacter sp.]|nr:hypothetical protein [Phaeodactylibacter sp.]